WCSGSSRRPRRPPWTMGCRVLTRPPMISGKPVTLSMGVTGTPAWARDWAVPPVEMISTPRDARVLAKGMRSVLSETERRAREMRTRSGMGDQMARGPQGQIAKLPKRQITKADCHCSGDAFMSQPGWGSPLQELRNDAGLADGVEVAIDEL